MIIELKNKKVEEQMKHLNKAIEIVGGVKYLEKENFESEILGQLIESIFKGEEASLFILEEKYSLEELLRIKLEFEKYFLKNKFKTINNVVEKIKKYNTILEGKIRKFKKTNSIEEFREISKEVEEKYAWEFDKLLLVNIKNRNEEENYYGDYLKEKRKQLIDSIFVKLGI